MSDGFQNTVVVTNSQFIEINYYNPSFSPTDTAVSALPSPNQPSASFTGHNEYQQRQIQEEPQGLDPQGLHWIPMSGNLKVGQLDTQSAEVGWEGSGSPLFIGRTHYNGGLHLGKVGPHVPGIFIPWNGKEVLLHQYEFLHILPGNPQGLHWVLVSGEVNLACLDGQPVKAGEGKDGLPLLIARACYEDGMHPGKVGTQGAYISWGGKAITIDEYEILCYAQCNKNVEPEMNGE